MPPRQTFFTAIRIEEWLDAILQRLDPGSGVVVREGFYDRAEEIAALCRERGLVLSIKGDVALAHRVGAAYVHKPQQDGCTLPISLPVHDPAQAREAAMRRASLIYISPVFATASHPERSPLGPREAARLARMVDCPAIALGGMDAERFGQLGPPFAGWAGIGAFAPPR